MLEGAGVNITRDKRKAEDLKLDFISGAFSKGTKKENERDSEEFERRT